MIIPYFDTENKARNIVASQLCVGSAPQSQLSEYSEIEIPYNANESVTAINLGREKKQRATETIPNVEGTGIHLNVDNQNSGRDLGCSTEADPSNEQQIPSMQTKTLPNQQQIKNYVELDSSTKEARSAPSVYKMLSNKKQQLVQSSPVTHISEVEDEPYYCFVNIPRLPTPKENSSVESNIDHLAA